MSESNAHGPRTLAANRLEINFTFYRSIAPAIRLKASHGNHETSENDDALGALAHDRKLGIARRIDVSGNRIVREAVGPYRYAPDPALHIDIEASEVQVRTWKTSELAGFLSDDFMSTLICGHFHVVFDPANFVNCDQDKFCVFDATHIPHVGDELLEREVSIAGVEGTVFRNGYVALVLRFYAKQDLEWQKLLDLIKRPDQLDKSPGIGLDQRFRNSVDSKYLSKKSCGHLNMIAFEVVDSISSCLQVALNNMDLEFEDHDTMTWTSEATLIENLDAPDKRSYLAWEAWSRPYVGVMFSGPDQKSHSIDDIRRLIISVGRTTPEFLDKFENPGPYLSSNRRNVYGDGGSIVFVASRGWCAYDAGNQNKDMFRLGVVEMTHFVIMALECSLRARRRFYYEIRNEGAEKIRSLNAIIGSRSFFGGARNKRIRRSISETTSFVGKAFIMAPFDDGAMLIGAHLKTHTARAASLRYKDLKLFDAMDTSANAILRHYVAALNSASSHIQARGISLAATAIIVTLCFAIISTILAIFQSERLVTNVVSILDSLRHR